MDCGCAVEGYQSDIRTFVFGDATAEQRKVWRQMRDGQQIAIETARVGVPAGASMTPCAPVREVGIWPGYKLPGLPHRTGHGDRARWPRPVNLVHGDRRRSHPACVLEASRDLSTGKFGIRLKIVSTWARKSRSGFRHHRHRLDKPFG
jgi:Xaa-Pro dipeptidase